MVTERADLTDLRSMDDPADPDDRSDADIADLADIADITETPVIFLKSSPEFRLAESNCPETPTISNR